MSDDAAIKLYEYLQYDNFSEVFRPWDPRFPDVAQRVAGLIRERMPDARVEHVGSTAIPGCAGKGVVDLLLMYTPGRLAAARDALDGLSFQRQTGLNPFPEERPLRLGAVAHDGELFRLHVHVVAADSPEAAEQLDFRERLCADPALVEEYVAHKRAALAAGTANNIDYNRAKEPFIHKVVGRPISVEKDE
ncbi:MAG: GrpB family protein [Chloroflexia bacterium]|nr:GrpB family protein [Chloroflexia bacterium]